VAESLDENASKEEKFVKVLRGGRNVYRVLVGKPEGKKHLEDQGVDGRMGSKWTLGRLVGGVEWIHLAQDVDCWRAVVNAAMKFRVVAPRS
jgi:hypothetical protein